LIAVKETDLQVAQEEKDKKDGELELLKVQVVKAEEVARGNSLANQELLELLVELSVI
jgi:hypothetical protein